MENYSCGQEGYAEKDREESQTMDFLVDLKYMISSKTCINEYFSKINCFYEVN
jgi:hypothetical protein